MNPEITEMLKVAGRFGEGKRFLMITLGCQMNEHDSEVIAAILKSIGYSTALTPEDADLIIINTCAVRKKPEDKVASLLGKYASLKNSKKDLIIAVGGCMTQQEDAANYIKERFHYVDLVFGTHALPRLPKLLEEAGGQKKGLIVDIEETYSSREGLPVAHSSHFKAWLPVIYGCNNFCSYCVVPYVRGREHSRSFEEVVSEARSLARRGYVELTLLGQNVNSYGHDLPGNYTFADLLTELNQVDGLERIRFMTSHPKDLSMKLIEAVRQGDKICEHFHLPVQSGSNRILDKMNRHYSREHYLELVEAIKGAVPGVSITSDIIVGFPGEAEEDLSETADLLERARFDSAFSFIYSPRNKTAAAELNDNLTYQQKEIRLQHLNEIQHRISKEINNQMANQSFELLVEGPSKSNPDVQTGRTRTNKLVHFTGSDRLVGKLVQVKITDVRTWNLIGKLEGELN
ncbi:MAG: tRNA (N6-isopentenyl adenosine(37)-C2)-methylthiotransferase MiaB [Clostridia bacterium]|nr:tRNA (N6-isopentenyl adenosine(37)-C2)-methylthiotransferase MiaB [Clostridia bacterium]